MLIVLLAAGGALTLAGRSRAGGAEGFVAKSDLTGQLNYNADPNGQDAGFSAHCDGYTFFKLVTLGDGSLKIIVRATCTDQDGPPFICGPP